LNSFAPSREFALLRDDIMSSCRMNTQYSELRSRLIAAELRIERIEKALPYTSILLTSS